MPFAQKDVIATFLTGIDESVEYGTISYFIKFLDEYPTELKDSIQLTEINKENLPKALKEIKNMKQKQINEFIGNIIKIKEENYTPILQ